MWPDDFSISWEQAGVVCTSAVIIYIVLIAFSRLVGPRSFAQLTAFDFAVTVALGAIVGATSTGAAPLANGVIALIVLFLLRWFVARARRPGLSKLVDNTPILIMAGPEILSSNLKKAKITETDLLQSLRSKGVTSLKDIKAVVMERDGSISVLKSADPIDPALLKDVEGYKNMQQKHREHLD